MVVPAVLILCAARPAPATQTTYQLGVLLSTGYNSQLAQPQPQAVTAIAPAPSDAILFTVAPLISLRVESGRITESLRYQFLGIGYGLLHAGPGQGPVTFSYQNILSSETRLDLTARTSWTIGIHGTQGRLNSFTQALDPTSRDLSALNLVNTDFVSFAASWLIDWQPSGRLHVLQPVMIRGYIPYGDPTANVSHTYSAEAGLGVAYEWARVTLGVEARIGWFQPSNVTLVSMRNGEDGELITGQLVGRATAELAPRWKLIAHAGVFVATLRDHFLEGCFQNCPGDPNYLGTGSPLYSTVAFPIGGLALSYLFPRIEWTASLDYQHGGASEVMLGGLTQTDSVMARLRMPLRPRVVLSGSAGFRFGAIAQAGGFGQGLSYGNCSQQLDPAVIGQSSPSLLSQCYYLIQADADLMWILRDWVHLSVRYQYLRQHFLVVQNPLGQDYNAHIGLLGVTFLYPPR